MSKNEPLLGAHMSIAGGLHLALERGAEVGCTAVQVFTKNASQWRERLLSVEEIGLFREARETHGIRSVMAHGGYLVNPASPDDSLWARSVKAMAKEVERCGQLDLPILVIHPGSHRGSGEAKGLHRVADALTRVLDETWVSGVRILLENTAGQGDTLGYRFEHLAEIIDAVGRSERLGVCYDTAHGFAAGYDLRTRGAWERTLGEMDAAVGLENVFALHLNDARKPLGSRVDRHDHIGRGHIGEEGFGFVMRNEIFSKVPKILETPKEEDGVSMDEINLGVLRRLARER